MQQKILLGISECLLGCKVRFNGGHQHNRYITDTLGEYFEFQSYCPEVAIGLGVPREPIRLTGDSTNPRAVGVKDPSFDVTDKLRAYSEHTSTNLPEPMCGFILKSKSPSCGMERVKIYHSNGNAHQSTSGIFAEALMRLHPNLPVEEEGRLGDPVLRENFITRVYVYQRWQQFLQGEVTAKTLTDFHARHKLSLMAHDVESYKTLGRLLADLKNTDLDALATRYFSLLMQAFLHKANVGKNTNVLQHCAGYLKNDLDTFDRQELAGIIDRYHEGEIPLIVPITMLGHYFAKFPHEYMNQQVFLNPYPHSLRLRNAI